MAVVVDDRILLDVLARRTSVPLARELRSGGLFTTSSWYYRLGRAVFAGSGTGALSGPFASFEAEARDRVSAALLDLPDDVGLLHPRVVVPVMLALRVRRQLNVLTAEALGVASLVRGSLLVTTDAALLRSGAAELGITYDVVS